ncbi:MAG: MFS transporter [Halanaerobiales bacterium]
MHFFFFTTGIGVLLASLIFILLMNNKEIKKTSSTGDKISFKSQLKKVLNIFKKPDLSKFIIWATLVGGFGTFAIKGFESFIPTILAKIKGYSFTRANQLFAIIAINGLIFKMGVAWLADKFGTRRILAIMYFFNIAFFIIFTSQVAHIWNIVSLIIFGIYFKSHNTLINSYVMKLSPSRY